MANGSDLSLVLAPASAFSASDASAVDLCIGRTLDSEPARRPAAVSERSGIADLVAPTAAASRWRDRVLFSFLLPLFAPFSLAA